MKIRDLRHRINIEQPVPSENSLNEEVKLWQLFKSVRGSINCVGNGREQIKAYKDTLSLSYEITIRYTLGIDTSMRVVHKGKVFNIDHVVNYKELNKELHLFCTLIEEGVYNE